MKEIFAAALTAVTLAVNAEDEMSKVLKTK